MNINLTKQQWTIIGVVVAIIAVWYFFLRKKKETNEVSYVDVGPAGMGGGTRATNWGSKYSGVPSKKTIEGWQKGTTFLPTESNYRPVKILVCGNCGCPAGYRRESPSSNVCVPGGFI